MRTFFLVLAAMLLGCQPARRYQPLRLTKAEPTDQKEKAKTLPAHYSWITPKPVSDIPLLYVPTAAKEWAELPAFWNPWPPRPAGMPTAHFGLPPWNAAVALLLADRMEVIKLKVPLGLPDPTPQVPAANPLTYAKWHLGRAIFHDPILEGDTGRLACASCHQPNHGFTQEAAYNIKGGRNALSLLNVVYNKQQFWDGRVDALEEVVVRSLEDESPRADSKAPGPEISHVWSGLVKKLVASPEYDGQFQAAFGIRQATQDSIAKALATYMRTILSGDSLYDKAEQERTRRGDGVLAARHFTPFLNEKTIAALEIGGVKSEEVARILEKGHALFLGRGRCAGCHFGPLFSDQGYHNTGWGMSEKYLDEPREGGRFSALPVGLKETRFIGAYRTPTLRNLPRTGPYFHDGLQPTLNQVLQYYAHGIWPGPHVDAALQSDPKGTSLNLEFEDIRALLGFLRCLDGTPTDPILLPRSRK